MLILDYPDWDQPMLFEEYIPKILFDMTPELSRIDQFLNNPIFEEPIVKRYHTRMGRPTVPVRVYIRMMVLKFYLCVSFEDLCEIIAKTPMYKRFCHIPMELEVPTPTALMKITKKYGEEIVKELNDNFILALQEQKIIKGRRLRVDTTVVESNIAYPTDAELLYKGTKQLDEAVSDAMELCSKGTQKKTKTKKKAKRKTKKKTQTLRIKLLSINKVVRRRTAETFKEVRQITGEMAAIAKEVAKKARKFAEKLIPETTGDKIQVNTLHHVLQTLEKIITQTEIVNSGGKPENRVVSMDDTDARPITKGKLGKRVEFGHVLQVEEVSEGIITGYKVFKGNPSDKTLLVDAIDHHVDLFKKAPREVSADRGYYSSLNETSLRDMGVKNVCIPKVGKKSKDRAEYESTPKFKQQMKFRAGVEARISCIKRSFGQRRSYLRGHKGTSIWCGYGIFAHNLWKASNLISS
jgi:IS5 family transposase